MQRALTRKACDSVWALVQHSPAISTNPQVASYVFVDDIYVFTYLFLTEYDVFEHVKC